jgi:radical SAM enzyme (TIGR01210 family)
MTVDDFDQATEFLREAEIAVRAFILLKPPLVVDENEAVEWTLRSIDHAFAAGAGCCSVIPTRAGNGAMEQLAERGAFAPPRLASLERVLEESIRLVHGRVFVDLWDAEMLAACQACRPARIERLRQMNLRQQVLSPVACHCGGPA